MASGACATWGEAVSGVATTFEAGIVPAADANWYAVYLSSQEVLGRGVASYLIKKETAPSRSDIRNTFALQHLLGTVFLLGTLALARPAAEWYGQRELLPLLMCTAAAAYFCSWRSVPVALLEREFAYGKIAVVELLDALLFGAIACAMAWTGRAIAGLAWAVFLRGLVPTIYALVVRPVSPAFVFERKTVAAAADFGSAVAGASMVNLAILWVPALVAGKLAGMEALGLARMALGLYGNFLFFTGVVLRLSFSTYSRLAGFPGELQKNVNRHVTALTVVAVPAVVLFAGLGRLWVPPLFGARWQALPELLLALAPGYLLVAVFWGVLTPALQVSGRHRQFLSGLAGFTVVYFLLASLLTPRWGAMGVAAAFSAAEVLLHLFLFQIYARLHGKLEHIWLAREIGVAMVFASVTWWVAGYHTFAAAGILVFYFAWWYFRNSRLLLALRVNAFA